MVLGNIERRKIQETVMELLKGSNMEETTEFKIRVSASERLGMDLSGSERRKFIRSVIENYLLSMAEEEGNDGDDDEETVPPLGNGDSQSQKQNKECGVVDNRTELQSTKVDADGNRFVCQLPSSRKVVVQGMKGERVVSIKKFYKKDGKLIPSIPGIGLPPDQWSTLKKNMPAVEEVVKTVQSKLSHGVCDKQDKQVPSCSHVVHDKQDKQIPSCSPGVCDKQDKQVSWLAATSVPQEFVPIRIIRFDGKNYHSWSAQMQLFLEQLNVAYVLSDPCPSITGNSEASSREIDIAKVAAEKWSNDDYICSHNILNSLSDSLFYQYSKKAMHAKEIWEELKSVYLFEESVTKRSQVKKYIEFEMVDGKSIVDQVQEFNCIADSIVASGTSVDENFHVSAVIAKLPPSWKDFSLKVRHVDFVPFWMLMDWLKAEEQSRKPDENGKMTNYSAYNNVNNLGPRIRDMRRPGSQWNRRDGEMDNKNLVCHYCGKKGHIAKHCRKKQSKENNLERDKQNPSSHAVREANVQQNE